MWQLSAGRARCVNTGSHLRKVLFSPCSRLILTLGVGRAQIWDMQGSLMLRKHLQAQPLHGSWVGDVLAVVGRMDAPSEAGVGLYPRGPGRLHVFSVQIAPLGLTCLYEASEGALVPSGWRLGHLQVSPDWQHIALLATNFLPGVISQLLVLRVNGGVCTRADLPRLHYKPHWSAAGDAVACDVLCAALVRLG